MADFQFRREPAIVGSVVAQSDGDSIGCRILVDGVVKAARIRYGVNAFAFRLLTAA